MLKTILVPIHRAGWPFIGLFAAISAVLGWISVPLGWVGLALTFWCVYFFRDPQRVTPTRDGLVISPADGVVCLIDKTQPPLELNMGEAERTRVCIFMNVFNVHINRSPMNGTVTALRYIPGRFINASLDKASEHNERQLVRMATPDGKDIAFVQIAGQIARRIVCYLKEGQPLKTGERFGLIRFGSRVDVYLPEGVEPLVAEGQITTSGETVLADTQSQEPPRTAESR